MDTSSLWLRVQEVWDLLEHQPMLRTALGLLMLLVAALALGRLVRFVILYAMKALGRQPALFWLNDFLHNKVFHRLAQMTP